MLKTLKVNTPQKKVQFLANNNARERYLAENQSDVACMQNFFSKSGLSLDRSIKCAERSIIRDIHTPRRLNYYVQSVPDFSLLSLGMDRFDADMVLEDLRNEFSTKIVPLKPVMRAVEAPRKVEAPTASVQTVTFLREKEPSSQIPKKLTVSEISVAKFMETLLEMNRSQNEDDGKKTVLNAVTALKKERSKKNVNADRPKRNPDDEDNVLDMQEYFRFAGLSVKMSRSCAEEAVSLTATSPKKLYKYLQAKRITLADLGMDIVDVEMVREALMKTFPSERKASKKPSPPPPPVAAPATAVPKIKIRSDTYSHGPDLNSDFKSDSSDYKDRSNDVTVQNSYMTDKDRDRHKDRSKERDRALSLQPYEFESNRAPSSSSIRPTVPDHSPFKRRQIISAYSRLNEPPIRLQPQPYPQTYKTQAVPLIRSHSQHYYPSPQMQPPQRDYDAFLSKLSCVMEDGSVSQFLSSPHSIGVSTALASLPHRPSSVYRPENLVPVPVHTELLLMRVASVLKIKH